MSAEIVRIVDAMQFAAEAHAMQRRKGVAAEPYVNHVVDVASRLARATNGTDATLIIGGLLHDVVEDCGVSLALLEQRFGTDVAALVAEVSDDKSLPKAERKLLQERHAATKSVRARRLKLADKTSNLCSLTESPPATWSVERRKEYLAWAGRVVDGCRGVDPILEQQFDEALALAAKAAAC